MAFVRNVSWREIRDTQILSVDVIDPQEGEKNIKTVTTMLNS